jgi:hypothetical protein
VQQFSEPMPNLSIKHQPDSAATDERAEFDPIQAGRRSIHIAFHLQGYCHCLQDYHNETQGKKPHPGTKAAFGGLIGLYQPLVTNHSNANTPKILELVNLKAEVTTELQVVGNELVALKDFDATKDDHSSFEQNQEP